MQNELVYTYFILNEDMKQNKKQNEMSSVLQMDYTN